MKYLYLYDSIRWEFDEEDESGIDGEELKKKIIKYIDSEEAILIAIYLKKNGYEVYDYAGIMKNYDNDIWDCFIWEIDFGQWTQAKTKIMARGRDKELIRYKDLI